MNVLITGAAGGLGRALAVECARSGYNLFLTDINDSGLRSIKLGLERQYGAAVIVKSCDLASSASVDELISVAEQYNIRFDMLLNVAGIDFEGDFRSREREKVVRIVCINDEAALRITHAMLERRRKNRPFYTVFVSSLASMFPMPLKATYAASKRFLLDFSLVLREELKNDNANVLVLCPGGMVTNDEVTAAIEAQGFFGNITTVPLEKVARRTVDKVIAGKYQYIPGAFNNFLSILGKILPRRLISAAICRRWNITQKRWLHG